MLVGCWLFSLCVCIYEVYSAVNELGGDRFTDGGRCTVCIFFFSQLSSNFRLT